MAHRSKEINIYTNEFSHMTKMTAMPIYDENPFKISFPGKSGFIEMKLVI